MQSFFIRVLMFRNRLLVEEHVPFVPKDSLLNVFLQDKKIRTQNRNLEVC